MNLPTCLVVCSCVPKGVRVCPFIGQISSLPHNRSLFPNPKFRRDAVVTAAGGKEEGGRNTQYSKGAPRPPLSDPFLRAFPHFPERHRHHIINTVFSFRPLSFDPRRAPGGRTADQFRLETDHGAGDDGDCGRGLLRRLVTSPRNPASAVEGDVEGLERGEREQSVLLNSGHT